MTFSFPYCFYFTWISLDYARHFEVVTNSIWNSLASISIFHTPVYFTDAKNCADKYNSGKRSNGVYSINPDGSGAFSIFCDQTTAGGGWTVFQKRLDGSVDFYLNWINYKTGFGSLNGEFWLGLDKIHRLTNSSNYKLRVDLEDMSGNTAYAEYSVFKVGNEATKYQLNVRNYSGKFSLRSLQNACASRLKNRVFRVLVHYPDV